MPGTGGFMNPPIRSTNHGSRQLLNSLLGSVLLPQSHSRFNP
jgi:hypothetical protein